MNRKLACRTLALSSLLTLSPLVLAVDSVGDLNWCPGSLECLAWSASEGAVHYNLYRGRGSQLPAVLDEVTDSCSVGAYATTTTGVFADGTPGPNDLQWYLVGAVDDLGQENTGQATTGPRSIDSSGDCQAVVTLVLNEVDYDQAGSDLAEFVEIYNHGSAAVDLSDVALILVNGGTLSEYRRVQLSDAGPELAAGGFLVVGAADVQAILPPDTPFVAFASASNNIQNGAPDGIALFDTASGALLDALSYEGSIGAAVIGGATGTYDLVEGDPTSIEDSNSVTGALGRFPDGRDNGDAAMDWFFIGVPSPGRPNPIP